ncbi:MAG TPA: transporter substrate-binding domain-containing protein [Polyangia bacterium]|nr:transporter substrate-binding domain-containing protein [Polyangia bacterium]
MLGRVAALAVLLYPLVAGATGKVEQIRARGKLIVSVKNDAKRSHKDPAHFQKRGFEVELAHLLARHILGDESRVELKILARPFRLPFLMNGSVDLVISMIPITAENTSKVDFSHPYFSSGMSLLVPANAPSLTLADLAGKTVAFRKQSYNDYGGELERFAAEHGVKVTIRYYPSFDAAVKAVASGEAVAMGGNFIDLDAYRNEHAGFVVNDKLLEERRVGVAVRKGDDDLLKLVNETIDDLKRTGELKRLTDKWHLPYLLPATG